MDTGMYMAANNSYVSLSPADDTRCNYGDGINLFGMSNLTIDCHGNILKVESPRDFDVSDAEVTFVDCYLDVEPTGAWIDNVGTDVEMWGGGFSGNIALGATLGIYSINEMVTLDVIDELGGKINDFDVTFSTLSGNPLADQVFHNDSTVYVQSQGYVGGVLTNYNNFSIDISSDLFGSSNSTSDVDLAVQKMFNFTLEDVIAPNVVLISPEITNESMSFSVFFDELVNGTMQIRYENMSVISDAAFSGYSNFSSVSAESLEPKKKYILNIDVADRFGNLGGLTQPYRTYVTLNVSYSANDSYDYKGDPESTDAFNFTSHINDLKVEFLEPVNLSDMNLSEEIEMDENLISIDSASRFNKAARLYFFNLPYQSMPFVLRNGSICSSPDCNVESYILRTLVLNVTGFSNYSTVSNSVLNFSSDNNYVGKSIVLQANYSRYNDSEPIVDNSSCEVSLDGSQFYNMTYNVITGFYEYNVSYGSNSTHNFDINCTSIGYDDKVLNVNFTPEYQIIDNFTTFLDFTRKPEFPTSKVTIQKNINVTINSDGYNNTNSFFDTNYFFMISKDIAYNQDGWNTTENMTSWVNIGKNEFFKIFHTLGNEFTYYELENGTIGNFSSFVFIDENETSLFVNVRACVPGGFCKYYANDNNNVIFEDTTPPSLIGDIDISRYYNSVDFLNFTFRVRDLESKVANVIFAVMKNTTHTNPNINTGFLENVNYTYSNLGYSFDEGEFYKIILRPTNKVGLSFDYYSEEFLIDTIAPVNSSFNISLNDNDYQNSSIINATFDVGNDYDENYSSLGKIASGIDYAQIYVSNATLSNNVCGSFRGFVPINRTFNETEGNYTMNLSSGYCYDFEYRVYDKAGNYNVVQFDRIVKIDTSSPVVNLVNGIQILDYTLSKPNNAEDIEKLYEDLDDSLILFRVRWDMEDLESTIDYYDVQLVDDNTGLVVRNWTNYTSEDFYVYYNSSYIFDNHNYKVRVIAVNKAGIRGPEVETNGATIFILKIPQLQVVSPLEVLPNYVLDLSDDDNTYLNFRDVNSFNITCKVYDIDIGYQNDSGDLCTPVSKGVVGCSFNTSIGLNNYSVSCRSDESIKYARTYNNENDNYDLQVMVEVNDPPYIVSVNGNSSYPTNYNLTENESLSLDFVLGDSDDMNVVVSNYTWKIGNLSVSFNGTSYRNEHTQIEFMNDSSTEESSLEIVDLGNNTKKYIFVFNGSINHSKIISLNEEKLNSYLSISSASGPDLVFDSTYDYESVDNLSSDFIGGVSGSPVLYDVISPYNISIIGNNVFWDLSDDEVRSGTHYFSVNITDGNDFILEEFSVNVTPLYHSPVLNESYYNLNKILNVESEKLFSMNLSGYFYEDNSAQGLSDHLRYFYANSDLVEVLFLDKSTGELFYVPDSFGNGSLKIGARNSLGDTTITVVNFTISDFDDNVTPSLVVNKPELGDNVTSGRKEVFLNLTSNENIKEVRVSNSGINFVACRGECKNYSGFVFVGNLVEGNNSLLISVEDAGGNINSSLVVVNFSLDTDLNGTADLYDNDSDGDMVLDVNDSIIGTNSSLFANFANLNLSINGSSNLNFDYNGSYPVVVSDNNYTYVDFDFDFSSGSLDLRGSSVIVEENTEVSYVVVTGLDLNGGTKSVYVPASSDERLTTMCVKDSSVSSITQMSNSCSASDEVIIKCPGISGNYNCSVYSQSGKDFWKISGLSHSATRLMCTEDWVYSDWGGCVSGTQKRTAIDINDCGTLFSRDVLSRSCNTGGGGGGGGSSGGSSSDDDDETLVDDGLDARDYSQSDNDYNEEPVSEEESKPEPKYIGNLAYDNVEIMINDFDNFSLMYEGDKVTGMFIIGDEVVFKSDDGSLELDIRREGEEMDWDSDGKSDTMLSFYENEGYYFLLNKVVPKVIEEIEPEQGQDDEDTFVTEPIENEDDSSIFMIILGGLLGIVLIIGAYLYTRKHKSATITSAAEPVKPTGETVTTQNGSARPESFDKLMDKFVEHTERLKSIVLSENEIFSMLHKDARIAVRSGASWVNVYYSLRNMGVYDFFARRIVDFEYLVDKFEEFYVKNHLESLSQDMRRKLLLSQEWFSECYFYDGDGSAIINDILFMLAGVNIYGFKRDKFKAVLEDEFIKGAKNFDSKKVDLSVVQLKNSHIERVLSIQKNLEDLRKIVEQDASLIDSYDFDDNQKLELKASSRELLDDIDKHLK